MKKERWEIWAENEKVLNRDFSAYLRKKAIRKGATALEAKGHLAKAKRNLYFARRIIDDLKGFYEWAIIAYYYAVYQAALSLCASKGCKTKRHIATLCILIKLFYPKHVSREDVRAIAGTMMMQDDIRGFAELKGYREDAAYSISTEYEKSLAESLGEKATAFVNKAEKILSKK